MTQMPPLLTDRWTQLRPHPVQNQYWQSRHRFNVVPAGRRSGKTELFKRRLIRRALDARTEWTPRFFAGAPTRDQAKRIFWNDFKLLLPPSLRSRAPSESELTLFAINGAEIVVIGMDKPERIEGSPWDGGGLDEYGNMKPQAWGMNVFPALADRNGWCDLIGVPEGRNHYYDIAVEAQAQMAAYGDESDWGYFHWKSADILDPKQIAAARRDLDELTFQQEYEGSFVNFVGRAYYPFAINIHADTPLPYNERAPLILCFDFNVDPGVAVVCQEMAMPEQTDEDGSQLIGTGVIGEVHIPKNSNTPAVCRKLLDDWGEHQGPVICYGDATGGNRGSAKVQGSDWTLVKEEFRNMWKGGVSYRVPAANPPERARINAMNSRLMSTDMRVRLLVDPVAAPHVVKDLDGVRLLAGGSGEIDKKATPALTHLSDGLGYYIVHEFPVGGKPRASQQDMW